MKLLKFWIYCLALLLFSYSHGSTLFEDAKVRKINEICSNYLGQIEESYGLNGLNITFAHPDNPSRMPSLHISVQKYNNGASSFSATLTPDGDYCYLSSVYITSINDQSCSEIKEIKLYDIPNLQVNEYLEGAYTILTPIDNSYQIILTSASEKNCTITETRMLWPGR
jgi:hypothetical protein